MSKTFNHTVNIYIPHIIVFKERDEFATKIASLHEDYYKHALKFANEQEIFQESIEREKNPTFPS